jgi:hypothetical protein
MKIWCVNTNIAKFSKGVMGNKYIAANIVVTQNRVVAWDYKRLTPNLSVIDQGDLVLSYNESKSIIGVGFAISNAQNFEVGSFFDKTSEQWIDIDWIWKDIENPIRTDSIVKSGKELIYHGIVLPWTNGIDTNKLLLEIGKRKI